ncbi:MAG: hypothetical protein AAGD25_06440 [Cyanobacteria bacterium P01_F01_bin.150]
MKMNVDEIPVQALGNRVKMVRGLWYADGIPYHRWVPAYQDGSTWYGHDDAQIISEVDAILEMHQLDVLADENL